MKKYLQIRNSPDGFAWGYAGSGPAQLALALAADILPDDAALRSYQTLKNEFVATLPKDKSWEVTEDLLRALLDEA